ncbi:uncharacterized protein [Drosophila takahashii]|uniref:uncharacterized protein n=1 Tax=Drosophila takahashii TaxID=29030 RepID=UPI001CF8F40E|nr:uncharacterized protein LOC108065951 [Drosophila takahashii]
MKPFVDIYFTEEPLPLEEQFNKVNQPLKRTLYGSPLKNQDLDNHMDSMENEERTPLLNSQNFNSVYGSSSYSYNDDFEYFPDLSQPLPNISFREQLRLTAVNRGKNLSWQRSHKKRLEEIWLSQFSMDILRD